MSEKHQARRREIEASLRASAQVELDTWFRPVDPTERACLHDALARLFHSKFDHDKTQAWREVEAFRELGIKRAAIAIQNAEAKTHQEPA